MAAFSSYQGKMHPKIPKILAASGFQQGSKEYYDVMRLLTDLSTTPTGQDILERYPTDVPIVLVPSNSKGIGGIRGMYRKNYVSVVKPATDNTVDMAQTLATLSHEMRHAIQKEEGYRDYRTEDPQQALFLEKAAELETIIQDAVVTHELARNNSRYASVPKGMNPNERKYQRYTLFEDLYQRNCQRNPELFQKMQNAQDPKEKQKYEDQLLRQTRTEMAEIFWNCDFSKLPDPKYREVVSHWNAAYNTQAMRNSLLQGVDDLDKQEKKGFWGRLSGFFGSIWDKCKRMVGLGHNEVLADGYASNMKIDKNGSFLLRTPGSMKMTDDGKDLVIQTHANGELVASSGWDSNSYKDKGKMKKIDSENEGITYCRISDACYAKQMKRRVPDEGQGKGLSARFRETGHVYVEPKPLTGKNRGRGK